MTGMASINGKLLMGYENYKNQEWLRRRKLRLEQVRKQSHDIAKTLREKVVSEEKLKNEIYQKVKEAEFKDWRAKRLAYLEEKLRSALKEFGEGYKLAAAEPDPSKIIQERNKINESAAQKRGEIAYYEELKMKKMEEERKMFPIQRKIMTRKIEDLRSALVRSVQVKKQLSDKCDVQTKECAFIKEKALDYSKINQPSADQTINNHLKKVARNKSKKKKPTEKCGDLVKTCACKNKVAAPEFYEAKDNETIWINLNNVQNSSTSSSVAQSRNIKCTARSSKTKTSEGIVEFYDFPSRYFCKSYKEFSHLVERIEPSEEPDAVELAKIEEEREEQEVKKRQVVEAITQERGLEALRREKINRDYQNMISKLDELSKKEKILKSQQRSFPSVVHMTDERLLEWSRTRQRLMNSKFENIYYSATADIPPPHTKFNRKTTESGDYFDLEDKEGAGLSFSAANLKQNSPVSVRSEDLTAPNQEQKEQLFLDIEKALREGRELRRTISRNWGSPESEETLKADRSVQASPLKGTKCQESQTDDLKLETRPDDSLPASTSTSYKSLPSEIKSAGLLQIIEHLGPSDNEQDNPNFKWKVKKLFDDCRKESCSNSESCPTLDYYIKKLLNMSRECVADLSVSSENISTPNLTDLDVRNDEMDMKVNSKWEETVRKSRMERADRLKKIIKTWKNILEKNKQKESETSEPEDEADGEIPVTEELNKKCVQYQIDEEPRPPYPPIVQHNYDQISKKCSERISELSNMLEKVRKDKEKLLTSTSGRSSEQDDIPPRFDTGRGDESTRAVADSQSYPDESLESWPDVMNELLRKEILTSPFKWSDGELSPTNSPTIETVIGDFRKEMNKIKTISFVSIDSFPMSNIVEEELEEEESEGGQESSIESINRALTSLGLNWAKSFLRKNEESRAMSSSSEGKSSEEDEND